VDQQNRRERRGGSLDDGDGDGDDDGGREGGRDTDYTAADVR